MNNEVKPYKRLWRSRKERKIAGVCGGLAEYFGVDPIWMRLIFVIFFLAGGAALFVYLVMWLIVPLEPLDLPGQEIQK
ncbi:MAG: PspC domain-containing protein [Legionella sp.]|nr:PspC domain-containing protein [Legionella sp.]HRD68894.1 PspC domain-containing protein [Legionella sp.]